MPQDDLAAARKDGGRRSPAGRRAMSGPSILKDLFLLFEQTSPLRISFEDLSGVLSDIGDFAVDKQWRVHSCEFCVFAKSRRATHRDCIVNKMAVNRVAGRRMEGFSGQCHLGLTEIVQPLVYQGQLLGVFYFGSVILKGTESASRQRIRRYCARRKISALPFLAKLERVPRISAKDLAQATERLQLAVRICLRIIEAYGMPSERYNARSDAYQAHLRGHHSLVQGALRYVRQNYRDTIRLADLAAHLKCHPDHLCRLFRKQLGFGVSEFIERVRIDHARRLISTKRFSFGEIAFQVGFNDQSYFNRIFKARVGCTPREYANQSAERILQIER